MIKKILMLNIMLIIFTTIFMYNTISYASNKVERLKKEAQQILDAELDSNVSEINKYYNSLVQTKEKLNEAILEKTENTEELQKLKYQISMKAIEIDENIKISYVEDDSIKYMGYIPTMLGVNLENSAYSRKVTLLNYRGRNVSGKIAFSGAGTNLKQTACLFCQQQGGSLTSDSKSVTNIDDGEDGTLYVTDENGNVTFNQTVYTDYVGQRIGHHSEEVEGYEKAPNYFLTDKFGQLRPSEYYANVEADAGSYGEDNYHSTRSIASFKSSSRVFSEAQSYILAHAADNSGSYPTYVQQAYWLYQETSGGQEGELAEGVLPNSSGFPEDADGAGTTIEANAKQLAQEALKLEEVGGTGNSAQNTSDMNECTVVYNTNENCWYAGPFTISYEREILKVDNGATSKIEQMQAGILENKVSGVVEYKGINNIKYYDESGRELRGVEILITNKGGRQLGDESYKFPYPNETFYIKIPYRGNENAKKFKTMDIELFSLTAEGQGADLEGTYEKLGWWGRKYATLCTREAKCSIHQYENVGHLVRLYVGHNSTCPEDCTIVHIDYFPCTGEAWCTYHGGSATDDHIEKWDHYLVANDETRGPYDAQKLLCVEEAEIYMLFTPTTIAIEKDLTIKMGGTVFEDEHSGKESDQNGIKDTNEKGIKGVKVTITPIGDEGETRSTYTDVNGKWYMENLKVGQYNVEFEYDGQTYKSTKYLASGNPKALNDSKAQETENERQEFNNKFYEIANNTAINVNGTKSNLRYQTSNGISKIITRDSNTNIPLDLYKMRAKTPDDGTSSMVSELISISQKDMTIDRETYYAIYPILQNINLGLIKRAEADIGLTLDVYQSMTLVHGNKNVYTWNEREEEKEDAIIDITKRNDKYYDYEYEHEINKADYDYNANPEEALEIFVDYKVLIRNQSQTTTVYISELTSYYDNEYLGFSHVNSFTQCASYIVDRENMINNPVTWTNQAKYNTSVNKDNYKAMYTDGISNIEIGPGENIEVHIMFQVAKDEESKLIMDEGNLGKKNIVEINAYRTYENGKVAGKIDRDSNPGNANLSQYSTFEDDTDSASIFKLIFQKNWQKGNMIYGNVWEDIKEEGLYTEQGVKMGDLQYQFEEDKLVNNVLVELYKINLDKTEEKIAETRTGTNGLPDGNYEFTNLSSGDYKVKFTYGDEYQLSYDVKYNGQDYQALNGNPKLKTLEPIEFMIIIDISNSWMLDNRWAILQQALIDLVDELFNTVEDIKIGFVYSAEARNPMLNARLMSPLTDDVDALKNMIRNSRYGYAWHLPTAMDIALEQLSEHTEKVVYVITDGYADTMNASSLNEAHYSNTAIAEHRAALLAAEAKGAKVVSLAYSAYGDPHAYFPNNDTRRIYGITGNSRWPVTTGIARYMEYIDVLRNPNIIGEYVRNVAFEDVILSLFGQEVLDRISRTGIQYASETEQSRKATITPYETMEYINAQVLDTETIEEFDRNQKTDKQQAIKELANATKIEAVTEEIVKIKEIAYQNVTKQVDLMLVERPKVEIETEEEIVGIQLILSDGTILIDTEKGLTNYVNALNVKGMDKTVNIDNELQQGSTIKIKYKIKIRNTGEVDTYGSYFTYDLQNPVQVQEYEQTIPTTASMVYSYVNKNMRFRQEDNPQWTIVTDTTILSQEVQKAVKNQECIVVKTNSLSTPLYPETSKEAQQGQPSSISTTLILSKVMSTEDATDSLTYTNSIEIVQRQNKVGRRDYNGVPGNYKPNSDIVEHDSAKADSVIIVPPFGEQRLYYILTAIIIAIISLSIVLIKKYVIGQKKCTVMCIFFVTS